MRACSSLKRTTRARMNGLQTVRRIMHAGKSTRAEIATMWKRARKAKKI